MWSVRHGRVTTKSLRWRCCRAVAVRAGDSKSYLRDDAALPWFSEFGIQQTRGFRALKLWMALRAVGADGYRREVSRQPPQAARLVS
jgi:glutamate/tyrosine decarboxylase-like PLP-dependent enzyme